MGMQKFKWQSAIALRFFLFILLASHSAGADPAKDPFSGKSDMNGHTLKEFNGFEKNWKLVTVRYRKDTSEMRFTYANELAWKSLKAGVTEYPKGAVFAKIGLATQEDPSFASSAVPTGARRYQFMIRDKKKYAETDGWGYALFDANGKTFPGEPNHASLACAACHRIVPEKGYVFSQIMELSPFRSSAIGTTNSTSGLIGRILFQTKSVDKLPERIRKHFPLKTVNYSELTGSIAENVFQGSLDEIRPSLAQQAAKSTQPAALVSLDHQMFSIVYQTDEKDACPAGEIQMMGVHSLDKISDKIYSIRFCSKMLDLPK